MTCVAVRFRVSIASVMGMLRVLGVRSFNRRNTARRTKDRAKANGEQQDKLEKRAGFIRHIGEAALPIAAGGASARGEVSRFSYIADALYIARAMQLFDFLYAPIRKLTRKVTPPDGEWRETGGFPGFSEESEIFIAACSVFHRRDRTGNRSGVSRLQHGTACAKAASL